MLEAEEVEALVEYYSLIPTAEHRLEFDRNIISKIEEAIAGVEYADGEEKEEVIGALDDNVLKNLERYLELLEQTRQNAISELESRV